MGQNIPVRSVLCWLDVVLKLCQKFLDFLYFASKIILTSWEYLVGICPMHLTESTGTSVSPFQQVVWGLTPCCFGAQLTSLASTKNGFIKLSNAWYVINEKGICKVLDHTEEEYNIKKHEGNYQPVCWTLWSLQPKDWFNQLPSWILVGTTQNCLQF